MPMGNIETYLQVIPDDTVKKVVGDEIYAAYEKAYNAVTGTRPDGEAIASDIELNEAIEEGISNNPETDTKEWCDWADAYARLTDTFKEKTNLSLYAEYTHDDGDCYDDIQGHQWYWCVPENEVFTPRRRTEAAREFEKTYGCIDTDQRFSYFG